MKGYRFITILIIILSMVAQTAPLRAQQNIRTFCLTWDANPPSDNVLGYNLYWKWGADSQFTRKANAEGLIPPDQNTKYCFEIDIGTRSLIQFVATAVNAVDESGYSNQVDIPLKGPPSPPAGLKIFIQIDIEIP